ncbi:MAG: 3-methyl-2-oxobutanoate hydroxymethyltransferase [Wenzhouxiangellaceae bacterium]|nr:3-methyl-2-oxobutanoate hydroxymethyltransferase [Wenzhouxiangellaceae bacterium]
MSSVEKITLRSLLEMKRSGRPISMLTAYDASFAGLLDRAGIDCVLVGDSLGNVIQGRDSTVPVSVDDMVYHVHCVRRGLKRAMLIGDMPFLSYSDPATAVDTARRLMQAGAEMVKLEGGQVVIESVAALSSLGVPVCGHLGLTPQSVHQLSGYRVQGREPDARKQLLNDAGALEKAGAALLVLECIPDLLGAEVAAALSIPVIGIGAGPKVDGQVLVLYDALGLGTGSKPRFVRNFLSGRDSLEHAVGAFIQAVQDREFPAPNESYGN